MIMLRDDSRDCSTDKVLPLPFQHWSHFLVLGPTTTSMSTLSLAHLPLRPSTLSLFHQRGFYTVVEVEQAKSSGGLSNLAAELGVSLPEASQLYREIAAERPSTPTQAPVPRSIVTFCRKIDQLLGGGIATGQLTELSGPPGVGKTQWALQLAVNARLPREFGGVAGEVAIIDSEGSIDAERCHALAVALVQHVKLGAQRRQQTIPDDWSVETVLKGIHVYRVYDQAAQTAALYSLSSQTNLRLVLIDSIAFHYRASDDYSARTQHLIDMARFLTDLSAQKQLAVVAINQMTTKPDGSQVPALGEAWAHAVTTRLQLTSQRTCRLIKSPSLPPGEASYVILECGVRGDDYVGAKKRKSAATCG